MRLLPFFILREFTAGETALKSKTVRKPLTGAIKVKTKNKLKVELSERRSREMEKMKKDRDSNSGCPW